MMDFANALEALKYDGSRIRRARWNGKGMWLVLIGASQYGVTLSRALDDHGVSVADTGQADVGTALTDKPLDVLPWIGMKTADDKFVPWLASQTDLLADDWEIAE